MWVEKLILNISKSKSEISYCKELLPLNMLYWGALKHLWLGWNRWAWQLKPLQPVCLYVWNYLGRRGPVRKIHRGSGSEPGVPSHPPRCKAVNRYDSSRQDGALSRRFPSPQASSVLPAHLTVFAQRKAPAAQLNTRGKLNIILPLSQISSS